MRIVCISDTHGQHEGLTIPDGDVLIHAGDICGLDNLHEYDDFDRWIGELPHTDKFVIGGNHDGSFQGGSALAAITNYIYLQDSGITIGETKFYGSPWTPPFQNWHFMAGPEEIAKKWAAIPQDTDVLITHGPPWGIFDNVMLDGAGHQGCPGLLAAIRRVRPMLHVCGHIHEGYGKGRGSSTYFVNASSVDENYRLVNAPIVVDL